MASGPRPQARCQPSDELERLRESLRQNLHEADLERRRWASSLAGTQSRFFDTARQVVEQQDTLAALRLELVRTAQQSELRGAALAQAMRCQQQGGHPELQARNAELQAQVEQLQSARAIDRELRVDLARARTTAEQHRDRDQDRIERLQNQVDLLTAELVARQATIDELSSQADQRELAVAKMEAVIVRLREQLAEAVKTSAASKRSRRVRSPEGTPAKRAPKKPTDRPAAKDPIAVVPTEAPVRKPLARRMIDRAKRLIEPAAHSVGLLRWLARSPR